MGFAIGAIAIGAAVAVVGFVAGGIFCIAADIFLSNWLDELIDKIAK